MRARPDSLPLPSSSPRRLLPRLLAAAFGMVLPAGLHAEPSLSWRGMLLVPGSAGTPPERVAETSGITWIGEDRYLAAMDGSDRALLLRVVVADDGAPVEATAEGTIPLESSRDWEDVAVVGSRLGLRLFAVEEGTPGLREFLLSADLRHARPTAAFSLRPAMPGMRPNRGPEALAIDPDGASLWTTSEETLAGDGPEVGDGVRGRVRLMRMPVPQAVRGRRGRDPVPDRSEWLYEIDPPHDRLGPGIGPLFSGVVALAALGDGRLLVLERSAGVGLPPFENRVYLVDVPLARGAVGPAPITAEPLRKTLLWRGALGVNLEGLCVGPDLEDGRRVVVGVADNAAGESTPGKDAPANPLAVFTFDGRTADDDAPGE